MISYDRTRRFSLIFAYRDTVWSHILPQMTAFALFTAALWLCGHYLCPVPALNPLGHTVMGVTVGMLIVFRNNCSYDRFWEGRKLWGTIVAQCRNFVRTASAFMSDPPEELPGLVVAYVHGLKHQLRGQRGPGTPDPTLLAWRLSAWVKAQFAAGKFDIATARALDASVSSLMDCQAGCERILTTPLPYAYAVHIKQMLFVYLVSLPFVLLPLMGWMAIPAVAGIVFGLLGVELVGVEIEDPFGTEANDLAVDAFCAQVQQDAANMLALARRRAGQGTNLRAA